MPKAIADVPCKSSLSVYKQSQRTLIPSAAIIASLTPKN